jgi:phosphatidylglycerol lysyltransferase
MNPKIKQLLGPFISIVLFATAGWVLHNELKTFHFHDIIGYIDGISSGRMWAATGLTVFSYIVMTGYDVLALRYIGHPLSYLKTGLASFIGYAFSNNIGLSMIAGASVRYRLYSAWGLSTLEIAQVVLFCTLTLWLGFLLLGGIVFVSEPMTLPNALHIPFGSLHILGYVMIAVVFAYAVFSIATRKTFIIKEMEINIPSSSLASFQVGVAVLDWVMAGGVLYALIGASSKITFLSFMQIFMLAQFSGLVSQVPGGMGVFETVIVALMSARIPAAKIFASLVVYRVMYYWLPLFTAVFLLGSQEAIRHKTLSVKLWEVFGRWVSPVMPQVLGIGSMVGGAILMFSGATPAIESRVEFLTYIIPLPFLELSHFIGSIAGMGLILLGRGLQRRLDAAWVLTMTLLAIGIAASLFKGIDYEEAILLAAIGAGLLPCHRYFYRKSSLFSEPFSASWIAAILVIVSASIWLGLIAYRHVEYSHSLWWQFAFSGNASRFLRGTVGALSLLLFLTLFRLLRPVRLRQAECSPDDLTKAAAIIGQSPETNANLALLGDKVFLFSENNNAFIMYGISGRCWISMGDPVGPKHEWPELLWRFREIADEYGAWTVFYEVGHEDLYLYLDMGLSLIKLGEEARVPLSDFSLEGRSRKTLRYACHKLEKEGCRFELIPFEQVPEHMQELKEISDAWLAEKTTREKSFSLGSFSAEYIRHFPVCVVRVNGKMIAFANLWQGANQEELSLDLMRFVPDAPNGVMEYLFISLMLWGKEKGYKWFNLGMAPLSGLESRNLAPLWNRLGAFVYRYGENFYNFQGLRQYKEKFDPQWQPKYLASPGGIALPNIFAGLASLISGGIKGALSK